MKWLIRSPPLSTDSSRLTEGKNHRYHQPLVCAVNPIPAYVETRGPRMDLRVREVHDRDDFRQREEGYTNIISNLADHY